MRKTMKALGCLSLLFVMLVAISCSDDDKETLKYGTISGVIADEEGNALEGVKVTIGDTDKEATTTEEGNYYFDELLPAKYTVTAEKEGYDTNSKEVSVIIGGNSTLDIELKKTAVTLVVNFNGLLSEPNSEYMGPREGEPEEGQFYYPSTFTDPTGFASFNHYAPVYGNAFGGGFTYTNKEAHPEDPTYTNSGAITGKGIQGNTYLTAFSSTFNPAVITLEEACKPVKCHITNSTYTYCAIKEGNNICRPFGKDDYFKLTIIGKLEGEITNTVDLYLAINGIIVDEWVEVPLETLGKVDELNFEFESTDTGDWGINTPTYFCMDALTLAI